MINLNINYTNHILLDWHFSTIEVFKLVNLFSTFSISESVASSTGSDFIANPVTAFGNSFLTAPLALAELIKLFNPSTRFVKCFAWSSKLAVWSWVKVSRSITGSRGWVPLSNLQYNPLQNLIFWGDMFGFSTSFLPLWSNSGFTNSSAEFVRNPHSE